MTWGVSATSSRASPARGVPEQQIFIRARHLHVRLPGTPTELLAEFRAYYGPTMNAFDAAAASGRAAELQGELEAIFNLHNAGTGPGTTSIPRRTYASPSRPERGVRAPASNGTGVEVRTYNKLTTTQVVMLHSRIPATPRAWKVSSLTPWTVEDCYLGSRLRFLEAVRRGRADSRSGRDGDA